MKYVHYGLLWLSLCYLFIVKYPELREKIIYLLQLWKEI